MKAHYLPILCLLLFLSACALPMQYSGETRPRPTTRIDVYYKHSEVRKPFKVLGIMTDHKYGHDFNRKHFEKFARKAGGDAIVILSTDHEESTDAKTVRAELIVYE